MKILNSIQKLESDIKNLNTKFTYSNINQNVAYSNRNEDDQEFRNEKNEQDEESKVLQGNQPNNNYFVPQNRFTKQIDELPKGSKRLVPNEFNSSSDARITVPIHASQFENE